MINNLFVATLLRSGKRHSSATNIDNYSLFSYDTVYPPQCFPSLHLGTIYVQAVDWFEPLDALAENDTSANGVHKGPY